MSELTMTDLFCGLGGSSTGAPAARDLIHAVAESLRAPSEAAVAA